MEVLENTGARRFDFDAVVAAIRTSGRFLYMMCEQEKTGPKENGDGRGGDEPDGNEVEEDADGEPLRRGAGGRCRSRGCCRKPRVRQQPLVPGIGAGVRLFGKHIGEACRTGGFGRPPRRGQLRRFSEPQGCRCSAGHIPPRPLQTGLTCDAYRPHANNTAASITSGTQMYAFSHQFPSARETDSFARGTEGSNPPSSSSESDANLNFAGASRSNDRLPALADDLVRRQVTVIAATSIPWPWRERRRRRRFRSDLHLAACAGAHRVQSPCAAWAHCCNVMVQSEGRKQ